MGAPAPGHANVAAGTEEAIVALTSNIRMLVERRFETGPCQPAGDIWLRRTNMRM